MYDFYMNIKVKINIPYQLYRQLLDDMIYFGFTKNNDEGNRNKFINRIFSSEYEDYLKRFKASAKYLVKRYDFLKSADIELVYKMVLSMSQKDAESGNKDYSFQILISNENVRAYKAVSSFFGEKFSASEFFRDMLNEFVLLKAVDKEKILFKPEIEMIKQAISFKNVLKIIIDDKKVSVMPHRLADGKYNRHLYLVCIDTATRKVCSYPLWKIRSIYITEKKFATKSQEIDFAEMTCHFAAEYPINTYETVRVDLTEEGVKTYNERPYLRPEPFNVDGKSYFFNCSYAHIIRYFLPFGKEAEVVSPRDVRQDIYNILENSLNKYKNTDK